MKNQSKNLCLVKFEVLHWKFSIMPISDHRSVQTEKNDSNEINSVDHHHIWLFFIAPSLLSYCCRVVEETLYMSDSLLHLFLQTELLPLSFLLSSLLLFFQHCCFIVVLLLQGSGGDVVHVGQLAASLPADRVITSLIPLVFIVALFFSIVASLLSYCCRVLEETLYLSDSLLHLFLQTVITFLIPPVFIVGPFSALLLHCCHIVAGFWRRRCTCRTACCISSCRQSYYLSHSSCLHCWSFFSIVASLLSYCCRVLEETLYLSDSLLHLFLQTELSPADMTACVLAGSGVNVSDVIVREERQKVSARRSSCLWVISSLILSHVSYF